MRLILRKHWVPIAATALFFAAVLLLGIAIHRDYGTFVDEWPQVDIGTRTYDFLKTRNPALLDFRDWEHGAIFETFTVWSYRFLPPRYQLMEIFYLRHLDTFLAFWLGGLAFFWLVAKKFASWKMGLLGSAFLFLSPVMFGNAFYNSKDIPLLTMYIVSLLTLTYFLERPNLLTAGLHALACGVLINIRIPGVIIPALTLGLLVVRAAAANRRAWDPHFKRTLLLGLVFLVLCAGFTVLFFPASWSNPPQRFVEAYIAMTKRSWTCCFNLFMGQRITAEIIPWYYIPVWMAVSTPIYYVVLFLVGAAAALLAFLKRPWDHLTAEKQHSLVYLGALLLPLLAVMVGRSTLYNGWRHMYFVYAPFLVLALDGFWQAWGWLRARLKPRLAAALLGGLTAVSCITVAVTMAQSHPYEAIYFNLLAGRSMPEIKQNYELDYWGLSYIEGMRYILAHDTRPLIRLASNQSHLKEYAFMLPDDDLPRFVFTTDPTGADYYMTDYYLHPEDYDYPNEVFSVQLFGAKLLSVFKLSP